MNQIGRNYVKFDFDNISLSDTWDIKIQQVKDLILQYIRSNKYHIYSKEYKDDTINFYAGTIKLTSLNEIYILLIFVYPNDDFCKYSYILNDLSNYLNNNTQFSNISLWYQLTKGKTKPSNDDSLIKISGENDICEDIFGYKIYISPNSFTQSNYNAMIELYNLINKITKEKRSKILHYYGRGMTPISHVLKDNFEKIYGYSSCKISYEDGIKSVVENNVKNIELLYDKSKDKFFENIGKDNDKTIIISASRNGFKKLDKVINVKFNNLIYIACNMKSFIQEIDGLPIIYNILGEIDMFPGTQYKEIVIEIKIKK